MKLKNKTSNKDWGSLAKGYLKLAEQGFLCIKNEKKINFPEKSGILCSLEDGSLIIASIWNIKHSLELIVKALGLKFGEQYWCEHDLLFLFNDLREKINKFSLKRDLDMLEVMVKKYHNCDFSNKTKFNDKLNNFLKYPEIDDNFLDYSFVHEIKDKEIKNFLNDIFNIKRVYDLLESEIDVYNAEYKFLKKGIDNKLLSIPTIKNPNYKN